MYCFRTIIKYLAIWILFSCITAQADLSDTIDKVRLSVVGVGTVLPARRLQSKGSSVILVGTGFVVGNGRLVVTNHHVISKELDVENNESLSVFVGRGKQAQTRSAKVLRSIPEQDLALLEISGPPLPPLELDITHLVREGEEVAFTGFPLGLVLGMYPATHKGIISAVTPVVIPAHTSATLSAEQIKRLRNPFAVYQLDAIAYPGNSGSPVYDINTGRVLGVVNSVFVKNTKESLLSRPSGISYAIPARYVYDLLIVD